MPAKKLLTDLFVETLEQAMDSVVVIDAKNEVVFYNASAEKLWGFSKSEVVGRNVKILVPDNIKSNHDGYVNANRETGENKIVGTHREVEIACKDGTNKWGSMSISKVNVGSDILYTAFVKDVTKGVLERKRVEMLSLVADKTDNAIFIADGSWNTVYINEGFKSLLGYEEADILGFTPISIIAPDFDFHKLSEIRTSLINGESIRIDAVLKKKDDQRLWCSIVANPVFDTAGKLINIVSILSEFTKTKIHEMLHSRVVGAIANDEPLELIMDSACEEVGSIFTDIILAILKVDEENFLQLLSAPKLPDSYKKVLRRIEICDSAASSGTAAYRNESVLVTDIENDPLWDKYRNKILRLGYKSCWSSPIVGDRDKPIGVVACYRKDNLPPSSLEKKIVDVLIPLCALAIERDKHKEDIRQLAYYDSLTKLPNRSMLHAEAEQALRDVKCNQGSLAVFFIDIDRFKLVNDSFGHPVGDKLLIEFALRLKSKCSNSDVCGRLSGDEFILIVLNKKEKELSLFADDLKLSLTKMVEVNGVKIIPSASIGISIFPDDGQDIGTLIHRSDMAMYQAKAAGKGRFSFFSHELNQLALERQELEVELQKAILNGELLLNYQPQVSMKTGALYGVEALARWNHPTFGSVSPGEFIPLAEECGLISDLTKWALLSACKQMSIWRVKGVAIPRVSVNLSPLNFHDIDLCDFIVRTLEKYNLSPEDIALELTESVLLDTNPSTMKVLNDIHSKGIRFSIDDFGTGYSSLSYLRKIPIKELKLDCSFVSELELDSKSQSLSCAILQIGQALDLDVIAEGIERYGQFNILKDQGYHVAQGYLFSKPLNSIELEKWIKDCNISAVLKRSNDSVF